MEASGSMIGSDIIKSVCQWTGHDTYIFLLDKLKALLVLSYVFICSLSFIAIKPMIEMLPQGMITWFLIGGGCYILGIIFYLWKKLPYHHLASLCFSWTYFSFFWNVVLSYLKNLSFLNNWKKS
jgi:channel protein (hemolysin III family)